MKKVTFLIVVIAAAFVLSGCAMAGSPVMGTVYTSVQAPHSVTSNESGSKVGEATCKSILGIVAIGNCSIDEAAKNGNVSKIKNVDYETFSILGIYATFTTKVYGE